MCLFHQAHGMRLEHAIFHQPFEAGITLEAVAVPANYRHFAAGKSLPEKLSAWRVEKIESTPVGLVSYPDGFEDSPDCEWLSSGINSKGPDSLALGRQGNFFLWGFIGEPRQMTESGKKVFLNSLCYIRKFDGQTPLVKKTAYARSKVLDCIAFVAAQSGSMREENTRRFFDERVRQESGGTPEGLAAYFEKNFEYLRDLETGDGYAGIDPDEDLQRLELSNRKPVFFETLIARWNADAHDELTPRLLERYVDDVKFESVERLSAWFEENRRFLYFSDVGGYRWFIDVRAKSRARKDAAPAAERR
jgi:hypothetical protein